MELQKLSLTNFKNIARADLELSPGVNCFLGNNGMGKSNLLDAIYLLSFCKSFTGVNDPLLIRRGETFAMVRGEYVRRGRPEVLSMGMTEGRRKRLKRGDKEYTRLSSHIGQFPLVIIAPQDIALITGSGEERRRWMDMVISQSDAAYLDALIRYNRALEQRNRMLRDGITDSTLFEAVEMPMEMTADLIHRHRREWIDSLRPIFSRHYASIAGDGEMPELTLESRQDEDDMDMHRLLADARERDRIIRHTTVGPHRDDIAMTLEGMPMRRTGSQGQCKSYTIALRLAQYDFLARTDETAPRPLLLLDDIFDKLDSRRVEHIMETVTSDNFGQIFITDTNRKHLDEIVEHGNTSAHRLWDVSDGCFNPLNSTAR